MRGGGSAASASICSVLAARRAVRMASSVGRGAELSRKSKTRIAVVNSHLARIGGAETYIDTVLPAPGAGGHQIAFLFEWSPAPGAPLIRLPAETQSWCTEQMGWERVTAALEAWRPDILYVHGMDDPSQMARVLRCAPAVLFAHGYYGTCISG